MSDAGEGSWESPYKYDARRGPNGFRTKMIFFPSKDFERDEKGDVLPLSIPPSDRQAAIEQRAREKMVAMAETKILREKVRWCYRREGVNYLENCRKHVLDYVARLAQPDFGMLKGSSYSVNRARESQVFGIDQKYPAGTTRTPLD